MWLLNLLFGGMAIGSGIKCMSEELDNKHHPDKLPNGVPYYCDHRGRKHLMDGTLLLSSAEEVVTVDGRLVWSRVSQENKEAIAKVGNQKYRYASINNPRANQPVTTDLNTGKGIGKIKKTTYSDGRVEYRKYYWYDIYAEEIYPGENLIGVHRVSPRSIKRDDPGILISEEEYNAIRNCPGTGKVSCRYHESDSEYVTVEKK